MSLSGNDPDYSSLDEAIGAGVFHPGRKHVISLAPEELDRFIGKLQGKVRCQDVGHKRRAKEGFEKVARNLKRGVKFSITAKRLYEI